MTTLYGIKNCDTVKKARRWLDDRGVEYTFHDFRADGITAPQVQAWLDLLGWETLVNKRSTTWKQLDDTQRSHMSNESATAIILQQPTLIKRPVLEHNAAVHVGFKAEQYVQWLQIA